MRYRILDHNGDITFGKSFQNITYGVYAPSGATSNTNKAKTFVWRMV